MPYNIEYVKTFGGAQYDRTRVVRLDPSGNIYLAGFFDGVCNFNPSSGTNMLTNNGSNDVFLTKLNPDGSFAWTKTMGGTGEDIGYSIAFDSGGNVYLVGSFSGTVDFNPGAGVDSKTSLGNNDIFITRINSDGSYGWTYTIGGTGYDEGLCVGVNNGKVYAAGYYSGTVNFNPGGAAENRTSVGGADNFLIQLDQNGIFGKVLVFGTDDNECTCSMCFDHSGNIYLTGYFKGSGDYDPGAGSNIVTVVGYGDIYNDGYDIFISRFNADMTYAWTRQYGNLHFNWGYSIAVDSKDNIYTAGTYENAWCQYKNIYLSKHLTNGDLVWEKIFGYSYGNDHWAREVVIDKADYVYVVGYVQTMMLPDPAGYGSSFACNAYSIDGFVAKYNSSGVYTWGMVFGGVNSDFNFSAAVDGNYNLYLAGYFDSNFTVSNINIVGAGLGDSYLIKLSQN